MPADKVIVEFDLSRQSTQDILDELTYIDYAHNRRVAPDVPPDRWQRIYGPTVKHMEARFQAENMAREQMN